MLSFFAVGLVLLFLVLFAISPSSGLFLFFSGTKILLFFFPVSLFSILLQRYSCVVLAFAPRLFFFEYFLFFAPCFFFEFLSVFPHGKSPLGSVVATSLFEDAIVRSLILHPVWRFLKPSLSLVHFAVLFFSDTFSVIFAFFSGPFITSTWQVFRGVLDPFGFDSLGVLCYFPSVIFGLERWFR